MEGPPTRETPCQDQTDPLYTFTLHHFPVLYPPRTIPSTDQAAGAAPFGCNQHPASSLIRESRGGGK